MADTLGAKPRKQVRYSTECPPWFKEAYSLRMDSSERSSMRWAPWMNRSRIASATRPPLRYHSSPLLVVAGIIHINFFGHDSLPLNG